MKALLISVIALAAGPVLAQDIDLPTLKTLMTQRQSQLELVAPGMSKRVLTASSYITQAGETCEYTETSTQTILRLFGDRMVVVARNSFTPVPSVACTNDNFQAFEETVLFYATLPKLVEDLAALDQNATGLQSAVREGDLVTLKLKLVSVSEDGSTLSDDVTVRYDLSKPSFKNIVLNQGTGYSITTEDVANVDPNSYDLSNVLFCENNDGDNSDCTMGNYSDILF